MKTMTLVLPSGHQEAIRLPPPPEEYEVHQFVEKACRYHIPSHTIQTAQKKGQWPNTQILQCPIGRNCLTKTETWTGQKEEWEKILTTQNQKKQTSHEEKIQNIKKGQQILNKLSKEDWACLKKIFKIEPHP